jgi:hypothetical protein
MAKEEVRIYVVDYYGVERKDKKTHDSACINVVVCSSYIHLIYLVDEMDVKYIQLLALAIV